MSINRDRLAGLATVLALLATLVLPGPIAGASPVGSSASQVAARSSQVVTSALQAVAGASQAAAGSSAGDSRSVAVPGALGAAPGVSSASAGDAVAPPRAKAKSVLLADEETGQVLFDRAERQPRAMASTTKVMTGLLALEHLDQRSTVVIGTEPTTVGEESMELRKGERLTVHQLLLGLLVKSANDAAVARADFRALVSTRHAQVPGPPRVRRFTNTNQLLGSYAWAVGGKTGFTGAAGRCLVASASRGGRRLVAVALGSPDAFADVRALFEYGFTAFDWVRLAQRGQAVTLAGTAGQTAAYHVTADVDVLVRRDLLDELTLAPPSRLVAVPNAPPAAASAAAGGLSTVWIQAGGQRLAPLRLGVQGDASATGTVQAIPPMSSVVPGLVPPGSVPAAIDPFLRRAEP